jgi:hypothetical protein
MRSAYFGEHPPLSKPADWQWPSTVTTRRIDRSTGKLATEFCPLDLVYDEVFTAGNEPTEMCDKHAPKPITPPVPGKDTIHAPGGPR